MRLQRTIRKACGPVGAVMILAYALMSLYYARRIPRQPEYYGQGSTLIASQWGKRSATVCGQEGCSPDDGGQESWVMPSHAGDGWTYKRGGVEVGRIASDGSTTGFANAKPSWYPSGMPQQYQTVGQVKPTGDMPPPGTQSIGQLPPTGVNPSKVAEDKARVPSGVTINGSPATESLARSALSDSAKAQGLKDYEEVMRLVIVGHEKERSPFTNIAKPWSDASKGKFILQEFEDEDWQIKAHAHAAKSLPEYQDGKPFAYLQKGDGAVKAIMFTPTEVLNKLKQLRPEIAPDFDATKARAMTQVSNDWLIWASAAFVGLMGLIGAVTSKPQA